MKPWSYLHGKAMKRIHAIRRASASGRAGADLRTVNEETRAGLRSGDEGQSLVEFALILPMMLAIMTAILSIGLAYWNQQSLSQGVGSAAQHLTTIRQTTTDPCADTLSALKLASPTLNYSSVVLTVTMNGTASTGTSCSGDQSDLLPGVPVTVYATYPCNIGVYGLNIFGSCKLSAKVTEYMY